MIDLPILVDRYQLMKVVVVEAQCIRVVQHERRIYKVVLRHYCAHIAGQVGDQLLLKHIGIYRVSLNL